jgi:hypothetical protein
MSLRHRERIEARVDGEDVTVYNWVNLEIPYVVHGGSTSEQFEPNIGAGDSPRTPDYVTEWVAEDLWHEHSIEVEDYGIEVVDIESDEVDVY